MKLNLLYLFILVNLCESAKILGIFNHPALSHTFLGKILLKNLAKRGHEVLMISAFPLEEPIANYKDIYLPELLEDMRSREHMYFSKNQVKELTDIRNMSLTHTEAVFKNENVQNLLKSDVKFDLILLDCFFNEALLIFGQIYKAPVIYIASYGNNMLTLDLTGNSLPFSYVPGGNIYMHDDMSFKDRLVKTVINFIFFASTKPRQNEQIQILQRYFDNVPSIEVLKQNIAVVFSNSHFSFETARPYTPNLIPIGGFHIDEEENLSLPLDLKQFLDETSEGVIYFSLGSQIKSSNLNRDKLRFILDAFKDINMKILWKYEADDLENVPKNVKILKWLPQKQVLRHPNIKLFITHGGLLSLIEGIYFAKPFLCMPFNGDQNMNAAFIESRQIGRHIYLHEINEDNFKELLIDVTTNKKYQDNIKLYSLLLREQPISPMNKAIYWVEHVINYKGAPHLKPYSLNLPWYKYYLLDVIALLLTIVIMLFTSFYYLIKKFLKLLKYGLFYFFLRQ